MDHVYEQAAWHVVAYHFERAQESRKKPKPKSTCLEVRRADCCHHVVPYLVELIGIALDHYDYEAVMIFIDLIYEYRAKCREG